jgi:hypothetical protein
LQINKWLSLASNGWREVDQSLSLIQTVKDASLERLGDVHTEYSIGYYCVSESKINVDVSQTT